jgi:hypothetical protein
MKDKNGNPLIVGQRALVSVVVAALPATPSGPIVVRVGDHQTTNGTHLSVYSKDILSGIHGAPAEGGAPTGPATEVRKRTHVGLGEQDIVVSTAPKLVSLAEKAAQPPPEATPPAPEMPSAPPASDEQG